MPQLELIAKQLGELYRELSLTQFTVGEQKSDYDARLVAITPPGGWLSDLPKSNAEQREAAAKKAEQEDGVLASIRKTLVDKRAYIAGLEGNIAALEAERRALEYGVKQEWAQAVKALAGALYANSGAAEAGTQIASASALEAAYDEAPF